MNGSFSDILLDWFDRNARDLPWRHTRNPYYIWLSEIILQQTRIAQGEAYWQRFVNTYPIVEDLAKASEDEVLLLWQGLGYYSRGRNLLKAARQIVASGTFPTTKEQWLKLAGVGEYTAAAVASFAFGEDVVAVDGNVNRVISRFFGIDEPIDSTKGKKEIAEIAQQCLPHGHSAVYNQALMDFGATVCTPQRPACNTCPMMEMCIARREHRVGELPAKMKKVQQRERHLTYIYVRWQGKVAIHRRGKGDIWQGLWEPLLIEDASLPPMKGSLRLLKKGLKHVLTHQLLFADFYLLDAEAEPMLPPDYQWIDEADFSAYAHPQLVERLMEYLP